MESLEAVLGIFLALSSVEDLVEPMELTSLDLFSAVVPLVARILCPP